MEKVMHHCPECGAPQVNNLDCWGMLGAIISWEYNDPDLLAEHFKTVATYNLQHPARFEPKAMEGLRKVFQQHIDNGLSIQEIRRRVSTLAEGNKRVLRHDADGSQAVMKQWSKTIADVYLPDQPQGAAERVRTWACSVRCEL